MSRKEAGGALWTLTGDLHFCPSEMGAFGGLGQMRDVDQGRCQQSGSSSHVGDRLKGCGQGQLGGFVGVRKRWKWWEQSGTRCVSMAEPTRLAEWVGWYEWERSGKVVEGLAVRAKDKPPWTCCSS